MTATTLMNPEPSSAPQALEAPEPANLLTVEGLRVSFPGEEGMVDAVRGVDFSVDAGEIVAVVGESGSGKTVSALSLLGLLPKQAKVEMDRGIIAGEDLTKARESALRAIRGRKVGVIFQDPLSSLNPVQRVGHQIAEAVTVQNGLRRSQARDRAVELLEQVGIPDPERRYRAYPHEFSGGMRQRAMIAMALVSEPSLLIADEPTTALDVTVQAQILDLIRRLQQELNMGVLLITHDLGVVAGTADRVVVMRRGEVVERGSTADILERPREQYTKDLLAAVPRLDEESHQTIRESDGGEILKVSDLRVDFGKVRRFRPEKSNLISAVNGVDLELGKSRTLGLVGESGCGKTTLGRAIIQLTRPTDGQVEIGGASLSGLSDKALRPLRTEFQIVFQDPQASLNPRFTVERILAEPLDMHDLVPGGPAEKRARIVELLELVGLGREHLKRRPHELSGGQRQRIGIARALAVEPELIVLDEAVSALDVSVQAEVLLLLQRLQEELGVAYLFIAHDLAVVRQISDEVAVMYLGRIVETGPVDKVYRAPSHPYTAALLSAVPVLSTERRRERIVLKGDPPSPGNIPPGCPFQNRCWLREKLGNPEICTTTRPDLTPAIDDMARSSACHFSGDVTASLPPESVPTADSSGATS